MDEELLKQIEQSSEDYAIEIYPGRRGILRRPQWRARIVSDRNGQTIFPSGEGYNNRQELRDICEAVCPHLTIRFVAK